jgi:hypothetical protein
MSHSGVSMHHAQPELLDDVHCGDISFYNTDEHSIQVSDNRIPIHKYVFMNSEQWMRSDVLVHVFSKMEDMNIEANKCKAPIKIVWWL